MTDDLTPPPAPRHSPTWSTPSGAPPGPGSQGPRLPSPTALKKRHPVLTHGAVALVALCIGVGIGNSGNSSGDGKAAAASPATTSAAPATTAPATTVPPQTTAAAPKPTTANPTPTKPKATRKPGPPTSFDGDGEYLVGEDISAGTYKTAGPADFGCYWERDKDSSGDFDSIIANDNLDGSGRVTVRKGEVFKTQGCKTWKKVG